MCDNPARFSPTLSSLSSTFKMLDFIVKSSIFGVLPGFTIYVLLNSFLIFLPVRKKSLRSHPASAGTGEAFLSVLLLYFCIFLLDPGKFPDDLYGSVCSGFAAVDAKVIAF